MSKSETLGTKIKNIRKKLNLSQTDFGKKFNPSASKGIVSKWESDSTVPSPDRLAVISELSGENVESLLYGSLRGAIISLIDEIDEKYYYLITDSTKKEEFIGSTNDLKKLTFKRDVYEYMQYLKYDSFCRESLKNLNSPVNPKNTNQDHTEALKEYQKNNFISARRYLLKNTLAVAQAQDVKPYQKNVLMSILLREEMAHFNGETRTNTGLLTAVSTGIEEIQNRVYSLSIDSDDNENSVEVLNKIDSSLLEKVNKILGDFQTQIINLSDDYEEF